MMVEEDRLPYADEPSPHAVPGVGDFEAIRTQLLDGRPYAADSKQRTEYLAERAQYVHESDRSGSAFAFGSMLAWVEPPKSPMAIDGLYLGQDRPLLVALPSLKASPVVSGDAVGLLCGSHFTDIEPPSTLDAAVASTRQLMIGMNENTASLVVGPDADSGLDALPSPQGELVASTDAIDLLDTTSDVAVDLPAPEESVFDASDPPSTLDAAATSTGQLVMDADASLALGAAGFDTALEPLVAEEYVFDVS